MTGEVLKGSQVFSFDQKTSPSAQFKIELIKQFKPH